MKQVIVSLSVLILFPFNVFAGFEIGNGKPVFNHTGNYIIYVPSSKVPTERPEIGFADRLTEVITPFGLGTPRTQLKINIVRNSLVETATSIRASIDDEDVWAPILLAGMNGIRKEKLLSTGVHQIEIRLFYRPKELIVFNIEGTPIGGLSAEFYMGIIRSLETFKVLN